MIDQPVFDELRGFGDDFVADLVEQFVLHTEELLVQLSEALEAGDPIAVARIAHSIRGSSAQMGGRRLALSCAQLEERAMAGRLPVSQNDLREMAVEYDELRRTMTQQLSTEWPLDMVRST